MCAQIITKILNISLCTRCMPTDYYALHNLIFISTLRGGLYSFHVIEKIEKCHRED